MVIMISKLILFLLFLPWRNHGFVPRSSYNYKCWLDHTYRCTKSDLNPIEIDDIMSEVQMALREADNALSGSVSSSSSNDSSSRSKPTSSPGSTSAEDSSSKVTNPISLEQLQDVIPTFFGGVLIGTIFGLAVDYKVSDISDFGILDPIVPPLVLASGFAVGGSSLVLAGGPAGEITARVLGGPIIAAATALTDSAKRKVQQTKQEIREIPTKLVSSAKDRAVETRDAVKQKVTNSIDDATETITSLPRNILGALKSGDVNKLVPLLVIPMVVVAGFTLVITLSDAGL